MLPQALSALLLGKSMASLLVPKLISFFHLDFFTSQVPSLTGELSMAKTYDLLEFVISIALMLIAYKLLVLLTSKSGRQKFMDWFLMIFSFIFWFQTIFSVFSGKSLIVFLVLSLGIYFLANVRIKNKDQMVWDWPVIIHGVFFGFWLMLVSNFTKNLPSLGLACLFLSPFIYLVLSQKGVLLVKAKLNTLFIFGVLFTFNIHWLYIWGIITVLLIWLENKAKLSLSVNIFNRFLYPAALIFIFTFNPLFFVGKFDFIEEGFWLGWISRLRLGQVLYRDVAVYHGPVLPLLMNWFMSWFHYSFYSFRLFLELIKVAGFIMIYLFSEKLLKNNIHRIFLVLVVAAICETLVKNNVEFRIGIGLTAILLWASYIDKNRFQDLFLSGTIVFLSLLTSMEVGLAAFVGLTLGILMRKNKIKELLYFGGGIALPGILILFVKLLTHSFFPMVEQLLFYAKAFSSGYFNAPIVRPPESAYLHWSLLYDYFGSEAFYWDLAMFVLAGGIIYLINLITTKKKFDLQSNIFGVLVIFTLVLSRSALGRSDIYHLLFLLIPGLMILFYLIEQSVNKYFGVIVMLILSLLVFRIQINQKFLSRVFYNWQNFGRVTSDYTISKVGNQEVWTLKEESAGINELSELSNYLHKNSYNEIFGYPWIPEIYYFADVKNPTSIDTPYAFFDNHFQNLLIDELKSKKPVIVYNPLRSFGGLDDNSLPLVTAYIKSYYIQADLVGNFKIMKLKSN